MDNNGLDIVSVIFLGIAVVIFLYLRSILGSRTGNERPYNPDTSDQTQSKRDDNVVSMPNHHRENREQAPEQPEVDIDDQIRKYAQDETVLSTGLHEIANADKNFDPEQFMQGAERAYEMIITAFSEGDKRTLKKLLAKDVLTGFSAAIDERESKGQSMATQFIGFDKATMLEAEIDNKQSEITVKFKSSLIRTVYGSEGEIIEGDEKEIDKVTDIWTFARAANGRDPNWKLIATESES
ncbi:Tim44/TimA family putative adaptor protein [Hyphomicrobiales bacterium 4NK60-0047b]|jgi:predicted lipid-binding transport protein (Tim44 family)